MFRQRRERRSCRCLVRQLGRIAFECDRLRVDRRHGRQRVRFARFDDRHRRGICGSLVFFRQIIRETDACAAGFQIGLPERFYKVSLFCAQLVLRGLHISRIKPMDLRSLQLSKLTVLIQFADQGRDLVRVFQIQILETYGACRAQSAVGDHDFFDACPGSLLKRLHKIGFGVIRPGIHQRLLQILPVQVVLLLIAFLDGVKFEVLDRRVSICLD